MDISEEKALEDIISPEHHPSSRQQRGPLPAVPHSTVKVTARGDDCYDSGVGELKYTHHSVPFYEGLNTLGNMETDVDGEVAYGVNDYSVSAPAAKGKSMELERKRKSVCVSAGSCACVATLFSCIAILLVLAAIACGLLIYFGILPFDTFLTAAQARQLQDNITAWNDQSEEMAKLLDRVTAELAALQATTAQLKADLTRLRASFNGSNETAINGSTVLGPKSYPATLVNMTLFRNCATTIVSTCNVFSGTYCLATYDLSTNGNRTLSVFCATASAAPQDRIVTTLNLDNNVAACVCSAQTVTHPTPCNLHVTACPDTDSFATVIET